MTDGRRTPQQHSHEHRQAHSSPGADAPGEEKPRTTSSRPGAARAEEGGAPERRGDSGAPERRADSGRADGKLEKAPCDGDFNGDGADVEGDLDELVKTSAQRDEYLALAQRTQADFENYRKRVARESASAQARGAILLAKELLPALDNLDRALEAAAQDDPLLDGVRIVRSELGAALARTGIESFSPADGAASGTVVEVYQPGYRCGETIIRAARVVVAA
jgi:molecular chaperone GrpE